MKRVPTSLEIARATARLRRLQRTEDARIVAEAPCTLCKASVDQPCDTRRPHGIGKPRSPHQERRADAQKAAE